MRNGPELVDRVRVSIRAVRTRVSVCQEHVVPCSRHRLWLASGHYNPGTAVISHGI